MTRRNNNNNNNNNIDNNDDKDNDNADEDNIVKQKVNNSNKKIKIPILGKNSDLGKKTAHNIAMLWRLITQFRVTILFNVTFL